MKNKCEKCLKEYTRFGKTGKYCPLCRKEIHRERMRIYSYKKYAFGGKEKKKLYRKTRSFAVQQKGVQQNNELKESLLWNPSEKIDIKKYLKFSIPFTWAASKNHSIGINRFQRVFRTKESREIQNSISEIVFYSSKKKEFVEGKIWLDIFIQKPNHRGDAVNFVDIICDGVKQGLGIDDRWFSIRRLDWQIVKYKPEIFIGIGQEIETAQKICSFCGKNKDQEHFLKDIHHCKDCLLAINEK